MDWDVSVSLSEPPSFEIQPLGTLTATKTHTNGGTFDVEYFVQPVLTFTRVDPPFDQRVLDTAGLVPPWRFSASGLPWVHSTDPSLDIFSPAEDAFVIGVEEVVPGDLGSQLIVPMPMVTDLGAALHEVEAAQSVSLPGVPLAGLALLGVVLATLGGGWAARVGTRG